MSGTVAWSYFANVLTKSADTFIANASIFGKVYFPRLVMPVSLVISNLIAFSIQFLFFIGFLIYYLSVGVKASPNIYMLFMPLLLFIMACLGLGLGIIISSMTTRYRDLKFLVTFGVNLFMYVTPVIYPMSSIPERFRWLAVVNPMAPVIETFRYGFLGAGMVDIYYLGYSFVTSVTLLLVAIAIFNRVERTFEDTI